MAHVGNGLVVGQGVDGGHHAFDNAQFVAQHFGHRRKAVGGAGSIGNHGHVVGNDIIVHTVNNGGIDVCFAGSGNQHFFRTAFQMHVGFGFAGKRACTFHHQIDPQIFPRQLGRVAGGEERDFVAVDDEVGCVVGNVCVKAAVYGVELGQVRVGFEAAAGIDGHDFQLVLKIVVIDGAQHLAADASVAVDGNFDAHGRILVYRVCEKETARIIANCSLM